MVWSGETSTGGLYTEVIEKNLEGGFEAIEKEINIINCGIPGYTTYQELEFLKIYDLDMQPDLVILAFAFNDVYYKYLHRPTEKKLLALEPKQQLHRFNTHSFPGVLFAKSYLAHRFFLKLEKSIKNIKGVPNLPFEHRLDQYLAWKDYGWNETNALIGEMQKLLNDRDIPMIIIIYPVIYQVDDNYLKIDKDYVLYPQKRIKNICVDYQIPFLDLTGPIYKRGGTDVFNDHLHLNNKGNDIVADEVTRFLNNNKRVWMSKPLSAFLP